MATQVVRPNGTSTTYSYYYECPIAQDNQTHTCPSGMSPCPYDTQSPPRNCSVQTLVAGTNPNGGTPNQSYADGVLQASIKDGLGRVVEVRDNLGGEPGSGYTGVQTRSTTTYDDLGLTAGATIQIGVSDPLIYTSTTTYDAQQRTSLVCAPRGVAQQIVYDEIGQNVLRLFNGTQKTQTEYNDAQLGTTTIACPLMAGGPTMASGACPTVASNTSSAVCTGNGYVSSTLHDGAGTEHSWVDSGNGSDPGASVSSVEGIPTYSADLLTYGFTTSTTPAQGNTTAAVSTVGSFTRDLQGLPLLMNMNVTDASDTTTTFTSDTSTYNNIGEMLTAVSPLSQNGGATLQETYAYDPNGLRTQRTSYAGLSFASSYDNMNRRTRHCYPGATSGSEGETYAYDAITGSLLTITHFTNPGGCASCSGGGVCPNDVPTESITFTYTRFGQIASKTYSDGTALEWAYDAYQRPSCFADAVATAGGNHCPASPTDAAFAPPANQLLSWFTYWPDSDTYRRGLLMSQCRGVATSGGDAVRCLDTDYYTSVDTGGSCDASLASAAGIYAEATKTTMLCAGGSCLQGTGTPVYTTTHLYDAYGRNCSVTSRNAANQLILGQTYSYDQYNNVVQETSASDLDDSSESNYQTTYGYDGMNRLVQVTRNNSTGDTLESTSYTYDAASNISQKIQTFPDTPTVPPETNTSPIPHATETRRVETATPTARATASATNPPTRTPGGGGSGCAITKPQDSPRGLLVVLAVAAVAAAHRRWRRRRHRQAARPALRVAVLLVAPVLAAAVPARAAHVITTTYAHNADGALTAVTTQTDDQTPTTTYFTWDNFTPSTSDPTTGTLQAANGNLVAIGSSPGMTMPTAQFQYDQRNRLTQCSLTGQPSVAYAYHPSSLLASSTLASGDSLHFYYGANAMISNVNQPSTGMTSSFLGELRYPGDGSEQSLLVPSKDVAAVYEPAAQTLAPYSYDAYGAQSPNPNASRGLSADASSYDMTQNPFQYSREYNDPACGLYYLGMRWYLPDQGIFMQRDAVDPMHHYAYTGGNPRNRTDHLGMTYELAGLEKFTQKLSTGVLGYALAAIPVLPALVQVASIVANPGGFWNTLAADHGRMGLAVAGSVLTEAVLNSAGSGAPLWAKMAVDAGSGALPALAQGIGRDHTESAIQIAEFTAVSSLFGRVVAPAGYRAFRAATAQRVGGSISTVDSGDYLSIHSQEEPQLASGRRESIEEDAGARRRSSIDTEVPTANDTEENRVKLKHALLRKNFSNYEAEEMSVYRSQRIKEGKPLYMMNSEDIEAYAQAMRDAYNQVHVISRRASSVTFGSARNSLLSLPDNPEK